MLKIEYITKDNCLNTNINNHLGDNFFIIKVLKTIKEDIIRQMDKSEEPISISDFSDYEKHWIIECSFDSENNLIIERKNKGYTATELIGLCEITLHRIIDSVELNAKHVRQLVTNNQ